MGWQVTLPTCSIGQSCITPRAAAEVAAVYQQCGYEADGGLSTVQMLANMEARLEELSLGVEDLP